MEGSETGFKNVLLCLQVFLFLLVRSLRKDLCH